MAHRMHRRTVRGMLTTTWADRECDDGKRVNMNKTEIKKMKSGTLIDGKNEKGNQCNSITLYIGYDVGINGQNLQFGV